VALGDAQDAEAIPQAVAAHVGDGGALGPRTNGGLGDRLGVAAIRDVGKRDQAGLELDVERDGPERVPQAADRHAVVAD